jgi:hypothetical protein
MALGARDDAIVYGCSLYVISRGLLWQARAALLKGAIMTAFGIGVLVQVAVKIARGLTPTVEVMGAGGLLAFAANVFCLGPALAAPGRRHQHALGVGLLAERCGRQRGGARGGRRGRADGLAWPDLAIGLLVAGMFGHSAFRVIRDASRAVALAR